MSLQKLKSDMSYLIDLSGEIAKYDQMLLYHNNMKDKRNYNPEKCDAIKKKISELQTIFFSLKEKWFD